MFQIVIILVLLALVAHVYAGVIDRKRRGSKKAQVAPTSSTQYIFTLYDRKSLKTIGTQTITAEDMRAAYLSADLIADVLGFNWKDLHSL